MNPAETLGVILVGYVLLTFGLGIIYAARVWLAYRRTTRGVKNAR